MAIFTMYHHRNHSEGVIFACQLTDETMPWIARIAKASMATGNDGVVRLYFEDGTLGKEIAEIGDYVVTDMVSRYWPFDKEIFESEYVE